MNKCFILSVIFSTVLLLVEFNPALQGRPKELNERPAIPATRNWLPIQ